MSKQQTIRSADSGTWFNQWSVGPRGYVMETQAGRYVGAVLRDGRNWMLTYGPSDEPMGMRFLTLDHATRWLMAHDDEQTGKVPA